MAGLEKLEAIIGYAFRNQHLLAQSLTHRSFSNRNNERLEFLGDSVLNFVIAQALFSRFPDASEGDLSRLRAKLVKQPTLAEVAREMELGEYLTLGSGEKKSGGRERDSILSDALEAIIGAILLDSGFEPASERILDWFDTRLDGMSSSDLQKDAKSALQEYLQSHGEPVPEYVLLRTLGKSPNQQFEVECRTEKLMNPVSAKGTSRRKAEQNAARIALERLGVVT